MAKSAREAALTILERCRRNQAFSDALLSDVMMASMLDEKDKALCSRLCYGVLQNMLLCDYYIDFYTDKSNKLEPKVRDILRISVYQILFMDKIPSHAAVSEGVDLCKKLGFSRASGLVNAVLRRIAANKDSLPEIPKSNTIQYLSIKYSTPLELVSLFTDEFGAEFTEDMLRANNEPAPLVIQTNTLKITPEELAALLERRRIVFRPHTFLPGCFEIFGSGNISEIPEHKDGLFYVQDAAACLSVLAANPQPGFTVLDACAAPGGKSFAAAIMMKGKGTILSRDIHEKKLGRIWEGAERLGIEIINTGIMDASSPEASLTNSCDIVIADVPCSGLGVIRKKPDIRYKKISELSKLPEIQFSILSGLAPCVKPGGVLIYSTCTVLKRENSEVVDRFLSEHKEFSPEGFSFPSPIGNIADGRLNLYPHIHGTDGFFVCKLRKCNEN